MLTNGEIYTAYIEAANQTLRPQDERIALAFARAIEAAVLAKLQAQSEPDPIYRLLASAWYYGDWKAETANERAMQALMEKAGWWPVTEEKLISSTAPVQQDERLKNLQDSHNALAEAHSNVLKENALLEAQNKTLLEALKVADKALRWVETTAASRAWDIVRAAIAAVENING